MTNRVKKPYNRPWSFKLGILWLICGGLIGGAFAQQGMKYDILLTKESSTSHYITWCYARLATLAMNPKRSDAKARSAIAEEVRRDAFHLWLRSQQGPDQEQARLFMDIYVLQLKSRVLREITDEKRRDPLGILWAETAGIKLTDFRLEDPAVSGNGEKSIRTYDHYRDLVKAFDEQF